MHNSHSSKLHALQKLSFREVADGITLDFMPVEDWYDTMPPYSLELRLYVESSNCPTLFVPCEAHLGDQFIDENMLTLSYYLCEHFYWKQILWPQSTNWQ